jgi:hypothetical protein
MSPPHPDAVGSWGAEACAWAELELGRKPRWWQRLALARLLEHDADGCLVWVDAFVSTARQVGKSVLLGDLALWRLAQAERFGEEQLILHTGKDIAVCAQVQRGARMWARVTDGWTPKETNGQQEVLAPDGSRWIVRALPSVYGYPASLALCDEAWDVPPARVEEGLEPTLTERQSGQLVLFSTAHRSATATVPVRRSAVLDAMTHRRPSQSLILEWSAPRDADPADREAWRLASPYWSPRRERLLEAKFARATSGQSVDPDEDDALESFRSQFLNVWPGRRIVASSKTELLVDADAWGLAADLHVPVPDGPIAVGIEDWYGLGAAAAAAVNLPDGRVLVWGDVFAHRGEAYAWASFTTGRRAGSRAIHGASMPEAEARDAVPDVDLAKAGTATTYAALPLVRSLLRTGRLVHSGDAAMTAQVCGVRVAPTSSGGLTPAHRGVRSDLLRAMAWAVAAVADPVEVPLDFFVY